MSKRMTEELPGFPGGSPGSPGRSERRRVWGAMSGPPSQQMSKVALARMQTTLAYRMPNETNSGVYEQSLGADPTWAPVRASKICVPT